jgi:hypothetical protein
MSRLNTLYLGRPEHAAEELDSTVTLDEVRLALINALNRIATLERQVAALTPRRRIEDIIG